jgi:hypothetical protein
VRPHPAVQHHDDEVLRFGKKRFSSIFEVVHSKEKRTGQSPQGEKRSFKLTLSADLIPK